MIPLVLLLPLLALSPFFCADAGPGWPSMVRDRLLLVMAWTATAVLAWTEPALAVFVGVILCHWRTRADMPAIVTITAGISLYLTARALPPDWFAFVIWVIVLAVSVQVTLALIQVTRARLDGQSRHVVRESARGTVGNRVVLGCLCAMALPLAGGPWLAVIVLGLLLTRSFSALVAAATATVVLWPQAWWMILVVGAGGWAFTQRHRPTPVSGMHARLVLAALCWKTLKRASWRPRLLGMGSGAFFRYSKWWLSHKQTTELFKHAHNDAVQVGFEWGALGLLACVAFTATGFARGAWGDPMTAALAAVAANALFQFPLHLPHVLVPTLILAGMIGR